MADSQAKDGTEEVAATTKVRLTEVGTEVIQAVGNRPTAEHSTKTLPDDTVKEATATKVIQKEVQKAVTALPKVNMEDPKVVTEVLKEDMVDLKVKARFFFFIVYC